MILGLNTCTIQSQIVIVKEDEVLAEENWPQGKNEAETLMKSVKKLLKQISASFNDIKGIVVITGPGPFTSTRVGVTAANALAYATESKIYALTTFDLLAKSVKQPALIICRASKREVFLAQDISPPINLLNNEAAEKIKAIISGNETYIKADIFPEQIEFFSEQGIEMDTEPVNFGEIIAKIKLSELTPVKIAATTFFKEPIITPSKKNQNIGVNIQ